MKPSASPVVPLAAIIFFSLAFPAVAPAPVFAASNKACFMCHAEKEFSHVKDGIKVSLYVGNKEFGESAHRALKCTDCHADALLEDGEHKPRLAPVNCGVCHTNSVVDYGAGTHGMARKANNNIAPVCADCHGTHYVQKAKSPGSTAARANIPQLCGGCHHEGAPVKRWDGKPDAKTNFSQKIHGGSFYEKGLIVAATCTDCHGSHRVLPATDPASSVSPDNVAATCTQCHTRAREMHKKITAGPLWSRHGGNAPACQACHQEHESAKKRYPAAAIADAVCLKCHSAKTGDAHSQKPVDAALLAGSVHAGIPCVQCHYKADPARHRPCETDMKVVCANCHAKYGDEFAASAHGAALNAGKRPVPGCADCHGGHGIKRHDDETSPTFRANVPKLCGGCHTAQGGTQPADYSKSVHAAGLEKKGLIISAVCTDCHNSHFIVARNDIRSPVNPRNVTATCANCHRGIYRQYVQGIHFSADPAQVKRYPACPDCHSSHDISQVGMDAFVLQSAKQCGRCHEDLSKSYLQTMHGKAYALGYAQSAKCSDCHDPHLTLPASHPDSSVGAKNIAATCGKCHKGITGNFTGYYTHATHKNRAKYPALFWAYMLMTGLLAGVFGFFGLHTVMWLPRAFQYARSRKTVLDSGGKYLLRFTLEERITHLFVIVSFLLLALTGLMIKFYDTPWAKALSGLMGVRMAGTIHHFCAVITFGYFFYHIYAVLRDYFRGEKTFWRFFFDKDSMVPNLQDLHDFIATVKWFAGKGPKPEYGRWTYWEKFDYLAVFWGVPIIGISGLFLWFPEFLTRFVPGWAVNIATIIHSEEALLAIGFIFTIHFFHTYLRPGAFPMDLVIFTGRVPLEKLKDERGREFREMEEHGDTAKRLVETAFPRQWEMAAYVFGAIALLTGITLILMILFSAISG